MLRVYSQTAGDGSTQLCSSPRAMNLIVRVSATNGSLAVRLEGRTPAANVPPPLDETMPGCSVLLLLGALCGAIKTGQGTLELWLETGETGKRSSFKGKYQYQSSALHLTLR